MNDYYLRCIETDVPTLIALGTLLGALETLTDDDGVSRVVAPGGALDIIGAVMSWDSGTMETIEGRSVRVGQTPSCDSNGVPYWHANLRTPVDLRGVAEKIAAENPGVAAGLADLSKFFVVDADGAAVPPKILHRVYL
jgi:hypothetical protein